MRTHARFNGELHGIKLLTAKLSKDAAKGGKIFFAVFARFSWRALRLKACAVEIYFWK
jgi:hypothetical protein